MWGHALVVSEPWETEQEDGKFESNHFIHPCPEVGYQEFAFVKRVHYMFLGARSQQSKSIRDTWTETPLGTPGNSQIYWPYFFCLQISIHSNIISSIDQVVLFLHMFLSQGLLIPSLQTLPTLFMYSWVAWAVARSPMKPWTVQMC